jgi:3-oxoadipate enol-lactonase
LPEERFIEVGGNKLHALVDGKAGAPWLTCLHGLAANAALWDAQAETFAASFRVLRTDMRGHGKSEAKNPASSFDDLIGDVVAIWDALGIERSNVLGLSMGGMTGVGLALEHPGRIVKLVAADCRVDCPQFFFDMWTQRQGLLREKGMDAVIEVTLPIWFTAATRTNRPDLVALARNMMAGTSEPGYIGASTAMQKMDFKRRLSAISAPTLFIAGAGDMWHPQEMREMASLAPGARYAEIPEAAHMSNLEQPERFTELVLDFLTE